ncbi:hypothetical protein Fuma_05206 [Fuerstiella marisgermanici]|uniref:Uncharacterized protein n=1 Tax=Fuerstiella marisgermanici TaxID=1891926 RepID=A0A1P8WND0_9PLAN|nr:hypothetical protein Fuma_05206 [Fuerstiella marisgermanici]
MRFLAYAMAYATHPDMQVIRSHVSDGELREVLPNAPTRIIDARSWAYCHVKMGRFPVPATPQWTFGTT